MEGVKVEYCLKISRAGYKRAMTTMEAWAVTDFLKSAKEWCVSDN